MSTLHDALLRKLSSVDVLTSVERGAALKLCADVRPVPRRKDIAREGDIPTHIHVVLSGWAARYNVLKNGRRRFTAFLLPGDFCDVHSTVLRRMDHGIMALTDCQIAHAPPELVNEVAGSTPALARAFCRGTLIDEAILRRWLVTMGRADALQAVGHLLGELYVRARLIGLATDYVLELPLTQEEIGDATGLTSVHVNRTLRRLRELEIVSFNAGSLVIHDVQRLHYVSGFNPNYLHLSAFDGRP